MKEERLVKYSLINFNFKFYNNAREVMGQTFNMTDYDKEYTDFKWNISEYFNFTSDVLDKWGEDSEKLAMLWVDLDLRPDDLHWNISDTGWAKAVWSSYFGPWNMGAAFFTHCTDKFEPSKTLELLQEFPKAFIVLADGYNPTDDLKTEIQNHVKTV